MSTELLQHFGLSHNEALLYELLVQTGEAPMKAIVSHSGLKRPTAYTALYELEKKGLVTKKDIQKIIHFQPAPPSDLLSLAEAKYKELDRAQKDLRALIPQLAQSYISAAQKPVVRIYEGVEGLKQIYEDTLKEGKEILAALQASTVDPTIYKWLTTTYVRKRVKLKIHTKVIVASSKESKEYKKKDVEELRITALVPSEQFPFEHEIDVYGDRVAFVHYKKDEPLIGIVITHPNIAKTMRALLSLAWLGAK